LPQAQRGIGLGLRELRNRILCRRSIGARHQMRQHKKG
jgi:hypothetical protein